MPFHTLRFFAFLMLVWPLFAVIPGTARWIVLLAASVVFFAALGHTSLVVALALVVVTSYVGGRFIDRSDGSAARRPIFWACVVGNVLVLAAFKYLPTVGIGTGLDGGVLLSTIGVSYFTFQGISYLTDVYIGSEKAERHLGVFALYMAFFPKLLQGPIERANSLIPQLRRPWRPDPEELRAAALLFLWGLFKKTVVADRVAPLVDAVYGQPGSHAGLVIAVATYLYAIQLYCDFSGYTDMALATARLFGIRLSPNFANPFLARSIAEFWRRWHISFSRWIQDYVFKPLQFGLRDWGTHGTVAALMVTFFVSGLWHGAGWTYVVWGLLQGVYMSASVYTEAPRRRIRDRLMKNTPRLVRAWQVFITVHLMLLSWVFFRAASVSDALLLLSRLSPSPDGVLSLVFVDGLWNLAVLAAGTLVVAWVDVVSGPRTNLQPTPGWARWAVGYSLATAVLILGVDGRGTFIYFQF